jgi:hypothetical protein
VQLTRPFFSLQLTFSRSTGINVKDEPFIAAMDLIGCLNFAKVSSPAF